MLAPRAVPPLPTPLHRRRWAVPGALGLLAAATLLVAVGGPASATAGGGTVTVTPRSVPAGARGGALTFTYTAPSTRTQGQLVVTVPAGWPRPQVAHPAHPGYVSLPSSTCARAAITAVRGTGPWGLVLQVVCAPGQRVTLRYAHLAVPTAAGEVGFAAALTTATGTTALSPTPTVTVAPGPLDHLVLSGGPAVIAPRPQSDTADYTGTFSATYTAAGADRYGNALGDVTAATDFSIQPDGGCSGPVCAVGATGPHTVTGTDGAATGTTTLTGDDSALTMSCRGEHYDVDGDVSDGCEQLRPDDGTTLASATHLGSVLCDDGDGHTVHATSQLLADARVHQDPAVAGFDTATGAAPEWYTVDATGGTLCVDDLSLTLTVTGSAQPACYQLTVITDRATSTAQTTTAGTATVTAGSGAYSDRTTIALELRRTCSTPQPGEAVGVTLDGHL